MLICNAAWSIIASSSMPLHIGVVDAFSMPPLSRVTSIRHAATTTVSMSTEGSNASQNDTVGQMLGGLVFLKTADRASLVDFYIGRLGMSTWLEQPNITVLNHGNMILGFHQIQSEDEPDLQGMYTFVYPSREQVDQMYAKLQDIADGEPRHNERYRIYQFFAKDPEGRNLEFQAFLHPLSEVSSKVTKEVH